MAGIEAGANRAAGCSRAAKSAAAAGSLASGGSAGAGGWLTCGRSCGRGARGGGWGSRRCIRWATTACRSARCGSGTAQQAQQAVGAGVAGVTQRGSKHIGSVWICHSLDPHLVGQVGAAVCQEHLRRAEEGQRQEGKPAKLQGGRDRGGEGKGGSEGCLHSTFHPPLAHPPSPAPSCPPTHRVLRGAGPQCGGEVVVHAAVVGGVGGPPQVGLVHRAVQPAGGSGRRAHDW